MRHFAQPVSNLHPQRGSLTPPLFFFFFKTTGQPMAHYPGFAHGELEGACVC